MWDKSQYIFIKHAKRKLKRQTREVYKLILQDQREVYILIVDAENFFAWPEELFPLIYVFKPGINPIDGFDVKTDLLCDPFVIEWGPWTLGYVSLEGRMDETTFENCKFSKHCFHTVPSGVIDPRTREMRDGFHYWDDFGNGYEGPFEPCSSGITLIRGLHSNIYLALYDEYPDWPD